MGMDTTPISQFSPTNPVPEQSHWYVDDGWSLQIPLFLHGFGWQTFDSTIIKQ